MINIVILFLVAMAVLAIFGRIRRPGSGKPARRCPKCKAHLIGKGPCACGWKG